MKNAPTDQPVPELNPRVQRHIRLHVPTEILAEGGASSGKTRLSLDTLIDRARKRIEAEADPDRLARHRLGLRFLIDEKARRLSRTVKSPHIRAWSPENAALAIWEAEEDRRRNGLRGLYAWDSRLRSSSKTPHLVAFPEGTWKCNAFLANVFNFDKTMRVDIGKNQTDPPQARSIRKGNVRQFRSAGFDLTKARPGMVITVDEGSESSSDHVGVIGYDPNGSGRLGVFHAVGGVDGATHEIRKDEPRRNGVVWDDLDYFQTRFKEMTSDPSTRFQLHSYAPAETRQSAKGGEGGEDRFALSRNFLATDEVPDTIFGIPVVSRREDYTEADLEFFREHPEAGGYYDLGEGTPEDGSPEGEPVQDDEPRDLKSLFGGMIRDYDGRTRTRQDIANRVIGEWHEAGKANGDPTAGDGAYDRIMAAAKTGDASALDGELLRPLPRAWKSVQPAQTPEGKALENALRAKQERDASRRSAEIRRGLAARWSAERDAAETARQSAPKSRGRDELREMMGQNGTVYYAGGEKVLVTPDGRSAPVPKDWRERLVGAKDGLPDAEVKEANLITGKVKTRSFLTGEELRQDSKGGKTRDPYPGISNNPDDEYRTAAGFVSEWAVRPEAGKKGSSK